MTETKNWIDELKVGDSVIVCGRNEHVGTVARFTATQVIVSISGRERRFNRKSCKQVGTSGWDSIWMNKATPERLAKAEHHEAMEKVRNALPCLSDLQDMSTETLRTLLAAIVDAKSKREPTD